ncbi:MAG: LutB/LldF family L-lactate oxidation iron-sulfur protein [Armatimonadota bacterium]|nr:LutB/LldF family L-lactate oxidation iron-sulfur protein [Armatimonadota bacterium]MDR7548612.1 LutB/LldF family L-lactate oxidation iron-sulfur protein [Armatimonadota bacterium]
MSGHRPSSIDIIGNTERALQDSALQRSLGVALPSLRKQRDAAAAEVPEWEDLRVAAARIKDSALAHLDGLLTRLEAEVTARGGLVHWATDADAARQIITGLVRTRGARRIVKSKSMTTEEIHLNAALEAVGATVVETDLGEYVLQLAGEAPSHLIAPAVHKSTAAIAELFSARLGVPRYERPEDLARVAREALRSDFLAADMGISGVNFAVAETGTLVIVENEGNARFTTTLPRVHVAVMGIEKVIPRLADLGVFLRLLARSGTGQRASVYVSLLTGPRRAGEIDGPEELHLIILDNGRIRLLADPDLREALRCIRCGACQNVCPVFERVGGHAYGAVYGGPIGAVVTPVLEGLDRASRLPFASTLCGACAEVCPVKIDIPRMLLVLRARAVRSGYVGRPDRLFARGWTFLMRSPARLRALGRLGRWLQRLVVRRGRIERLPYPWSGWTDHRTAPPLAARPFRDRWASMRQERGAVARGASGSSRGSL